MGVRKNQANLTPDERKAFVNAVLALKNTVPSRLHPDDSTRHRYDDYVETHMNSTMTSPGWAHQGPAFGPWHRYMLYQFERDLQAVDSTFTLPYWDWTVNTSSDPSATGSPWSNDFMGGDGDTNNDRKVMSGPFAYDAGNWTLRVITGDGPDSGARDDVPYLRREFMQNAQTLPTPQNVTDALQVVPYDAQNWDTTVPADQGFRNRLEGWVGNGSLHNRVHLWVGGTMLAMTSPNDPVFWLNHCNVDRLWAQWQQLYPAEGYHPTGVAPEIGPPGHNLNEAMIYYATGQSAPWDGSVTPANVLDHKALGYTYDSESAEAPQVTRHRVLAGAVAVPAEQTTSPTPMPVGTSTMPTMNMPSGMSRGPMSMFDLSSEDKAAGIK